MLSLQRFSADTERLFRKQSLCSRSLDVWLLLFNLYGKQQKMQRLSSGVTWPGTRTARVLHRL